MHDVEDACVYNRSHMRTGLSGTLLALSWSCKTSGTARTGSSERPAARLSSPGALVVQEPRPLLSCRLTGRCPDCSRQLLVRQLCGTTGLLNSSMTGSGAPKPCLVCPFTLLLQTG